MSEKKPESVLYTTCPKCQKPIQVDITAPLKSITDVFKFNDKVLAKEIKECLTNGWSTHKRATGKIGSKKKLSHTGLTSTIF